jgi:5-deoxy-D-glucuronate isomerase
MHAKERHDPGEELRVSTLTRPVLEKMTFRKTNSHVGRHISVSPRNSTNKYLAYGRIILNAKTPHVSFASGDRETGMVCLSGSAELRISSEKFHLGQCDAIYIPRDSQVEVRAQG